MRAGRELDALVAEKVMGWQRGYRNHSQNLDWPNAWTNAKGGPDEPPRYSTDIAAAWQVASVFKEATVRRFADGEWQAFVSNEIGAVGYTTPADTGPLAICLAALKALGAEVPE